MVFRLAIVLMGMLAVTSCSKSPGGLIEVKKGEFVVVRSASLEADKPVYGAFKIIDIGIKGRPFVTYRYLYMDDESAIVDFRSEEAKVGEEMIFEGTIRGIGFSSFTVAWAYKDMSSVWLQTHPPDVEDDARALGIQIIRTDFCATGRFDKGDLEGVDLSALFDTSCPSAIQPR